MSFLIGNTEVISDTQELVVKKITITGQTEPGGRGFGVGIYPGTLPNNFVEMVGTTDINSDNYGNYLYINPNTKNHSQMVWIPAFYYRIGHANNATYSTYQNNSVDTKPLEYFASETDANNSSYALHRAFIDGGEIKRGFFIDKYLASKDGTVSCRSIAGVEPVSLATSYVGDYANANATSGWTWTSLISTQGMANCSGIYTDAITLARSRETGRFQCTSVFQYAALGLLVSAHAQASTNSLNNAWYDPANIKNFPKGATTNPTVSNGVIDASDSSVVYNTSSVSLIKYNTTQYYKPLCGARSNFNRTTHNGQASGVADLNGLLWEVMVGITNPGSSSTSAAIMQTGDAYVLKAATKISDLTSDWNNSTSAWANSTNITINYDLAANILPYTSFFPTAGATGDTNWIKFGNGSNTVFSNTIALANTTEWTANNIGYIKTGCGLPESDNSLSATGTNNYGIDGFYRYNMANLFPLFGGDWNSGSFAGVFARYFYNNRSSGSSGVGFRVSAY